MPHKIGPWKRLAQLREYADIWNRLAFIDGHVFFQDSNGVVWGTEGPTNAYALVEAKDLTAADYRRALRLDPIRDQATIKLFDSFDLNHENPNHWRTLLMNVVVALHKDGHRRKGDKKWTRDALTRLGELLSRLPDALSDRVAAAQLRRNHPDKYGAITAKALSRHFREARRVWAEGQQPRRGA